MAARFQTLCLIALVLGSNAMPRVAQGEDAKACADAYVSAQKLRAASKLGESRAELLFCSREQCSATLRVDCLRWLGEVEATMPTVVFAVRSADGSDLSDVRVTMDGQKLGDHVGTGATPIDPGDHLFHFETAGAAPVEQQVVIREGEKLREIRAIFASPPAVPPPVRAAPPVVAYVVGGGGIVLLGLGAYFEVAGLSKRSTATTCASDAPSCTSTTYSGDVTSAKQSFVAGDVLVGAGLASLAVGAYLYFSRRHAEAPRVGALTVDFQTTLGGAITTVAGRF